MCAKNDDPLTTGQTYRSISLTISATGIIPLAGFVSFTFNGQTMTMPANADENSNVICTAAILTLNNIRSATCIMSNIATTTRGIYLSLSLYIYIFMYIQY